MDNNLSQAIYFIKSLPSTELIKVSEGELQIGFVNSTFQLIDPDKECCRLLFGGGENWLDCHVPDCDRKTEAVREYVIEYVRDMRWPTSVLSD